MFSWTAYCFIFCVVHSAQSETVDYDASDTGPGPYEGSQIWRTHLRTADDILLVKRLMDNEDISVWKLLPTEADFLVKRERRLYVHRQLRSRHLDHTVLIMNVQRRIDAQDIVPDQWDSLSLRRGHRMNWNKYPTLEIIQEYASFLAKNYPSICKNEIIGRTAENRNITMLTISNGNPSNAGFLLNAGSHAREWLAITSALVILREIVTKFDRQPSFIKDKNWYIIPVLNPDGYHYTYNNDRFWRKNRRKQRYCFGVDLNRNFNSSWFVNGITVTAECKDAYSGPHAFSEPETIAFRNTVLKLKQTGRLRASIDFHTYGQLILHPWSSKSAATAHKGLHNATTAGMYKAIFDHTKRKYHHGNAYHVIYPATGSTLDWIYDIGIVHSYVIEGQDNGGYGFLVPPTQIQGAGMEMFTAVKHLAKVISDQKTRSGHRSWF